MILYKCNHGGPLEEVIFAQRPKCSDWVAETGALVLLLLLNNL